MEELKEINVEGLEKIRLIELDACTNCGECIKWCPVIAVAPELGLSISPPAKIKTFKKILTAQHGLRRLLFGKKNNFFNHLFRTPVITQEDIDAFGNDLYACSTCRQCHMVCPAHIDTVELWERIRRAMINAGYGPLKTQQGLITSTKSYDNPWQQPRSQRARWTRIAKKAKRIKDVPVMLKPAK